MDEEEISTLEDLEKLEKSTVQMASHLEEQIKKKQDVLKNMQILRERAVKEGANDQVQRIVELLVLLKALEKREADMQAECDATLSQLQSEVSELDELIMRGSNTNSLPKYIDQSLSDALERLKSSKRELAAKLQDIISLKRRLGNVPIQAELIQYECRFSELYDHVQGKLRQTRKHYATYNALLEIKELMLKETSLLNSISSQFQDAITSDAGRMTLISSMEGIVKSIQQKLEKVQLSLQAEQKACEALKDKYTKENSEQRHFYSLLKDFQVIKNLNRRHLTAKEEKYYYLISREKTTITRLQNQIKDEFALFLFQNSVFDLLDAAKS